MPALAIDTATETCSLALGDRRRVLAEAGLDAGRSHLEMLLPAIDRMLTEAGLSKNDIDRISVGTGPGTFSGLRVGIATARALAQALMIPLAGAGSLKALALGLAECANAGDLVLPVIDAKRGQVFARLYRTFGETVTPESELFCLDPPDLIRMVWARSRVPVKAAGNGVLAYPELLAAPAALDPLPPGDGRHRIRAVYHLPEPGLRTEYDPRELLKVLPVYVRDPDADKTVLLRKKETWQ